MKISALLLALAFSTFSSLSAQSKYLDSVKNTFSFIGALGASESAFSTSVGGTFTIKSAVDLGFQIGTVKTKKNINDDNGASFIDEGSSAPTFSAQAYLYMMNQNRGNNINFGVLIAGSNIFYEEADQNSIIAGFHLSRRDTDDGLTSITFNFEPAFVIINELNIKESGRTLTGQPFFSGSISFGISRKLSDSKIIFFEPGIIYEHQGESVFGGLTIGLIL